MAVLRHREPCHSSTQALGSGDAQEPGARSVPSPLTRALSISCSHLSHRLPVGSSPLPETRSSRI